MFDFEKPLDFPDRDLSSTRGLSRAIKAAVLLALLIAYGFGFALLTPLAQESTRKSAAEGNDSMLLVGP
jgi:hypothetical protein